MTATKVIGESVKQTNRTFIKSYVNDYADAITENYRRYHIRTLKGNLSGNYPEYAREQLDAIENGTANLMKFKVYTLNFIKFAVPFSIASNCSLAYSG